MKKQHRDIAKRILRNIPFFGAAVKAMHRAQRRPFKLPPGSICFETSSFCNLKCSYCPQSVEGAIKEKGMMNRETMGRILENIDAKHIRSVGFTGIGETFLNKEWAVILGMVRKKFPAAIISMNTNGILLDYAKFESILENKVDTVSVSLNAVNKERYIQINRADHFDDLVAGIKAIIQRYQSSPAKFTRLQIQLLDTVNSDEEISDFIRKFSITENRYVTFYANPYSNWGGLIFEKKTKEERYPCTHLYIPDVNYRGEVYACGVGHANSDSEFLIGDLTKEPHEKVYQSANFMRLHEANMKGRLEMENKLCADCNSWNRIGNIYFKNPFPFGSKWL
ncbi:MAG: radical SAM protein [Nitrospinota bacterium]|nr:radical SAM protein [Nitrospinota bacterium]